MKPIRQLEVAELMVAEHPDFELRKMMLSGSLAKGTALKSISDIGVACYVSSASAPHKVSELVDWLATRLEKAFPNLKPEQIKRKTYSVSGDLPELPVGQLAAQGECQDLQPGGRNSRALATGVLPPAPRTKPSGQDC